MTKVDLFNTALMALGSLPLSKETDQGRDGKFCRAFYPIAARSVLESFSWNCATKRVALTPMEDTDPAYNADLTELTYQYALPNDYLKFISINNLPGARRLIENGFLYCDEEEMTLVYVSDISEPNLPTEHLKYSASLANAISLYLAFRLASSVVKDKKPEILYQEYLRALMEAQCFDANEKTGDEPGEWIVE